MKKNLDLEDKDIYESDAYIKALGTFIEKDFNNFRFENTDNTIGGMIVCRTGLQAKKIHTWFEENSTLKTGLVISDNADATQSKINKNNQLDFKNTLKPDILLVNFMLTTGYDVSRLKKMYLLRGPKEQSLLQTISRVNRPYKSPNGRVYKYGYIVDFVDIEKEYDRTIEAYIKELEAELNENGENEGSLSGLVIDKEDINKKYHKYVDSLENICIDVNTDNLENFSKQVSCFNKETLLKARRFLNGIKECETEFVLLRAFDYAKQIDSNRIKQLIRIIQNRIDFINLSSNTVQMMDIISNEEVIEIIYEFIKTQILILNLGELEFSKVEIEKLTKIVEAIQKEIKNNKNKEDIKIKKLNELLAEIFDKLSISNLSDIDEITNGLENILKQVMSINDENERLSKTYGGNFGFVKTYQSFIEHYPNLDEKDLERILVIIYEDIKDLLDKDVIVIQDRDNFIGAIKKHITKTLLKEKLYKGIKALYEPLLNELYTNIQLFK
ncbi:type I restriction enzyme subunit R domain-containing protein [Intestinibacter bartlettii]|uniref:type I restriction enzyme subunit R domain-containing protein n=1 Tax=Intestinibacter bartlettii TaxID=261299 RepID=UPI003AB9BAAC